MGTKITALPPILTVENTDVLPIVDITDTTTKKITIAQIETKLSASFLSSGDNISLLTNDSGYITVSDFSNDGENAGVNRDLGNLDAFALSFITSGVGRINIEAGGNVGIGTSTPTEVLDVLGNVFVTGTQKIKTDYLSSNLSLENTSGSSTYEIGVGVAGVSVETLYFNNRLGNRTFGINLDGRFDIIEKVNLEDNIELKWGNNVSYGAFFDASYEQTMTFNNSGGRNISFDNKAAAGNPNYTFNWSGAIKGNFGIGTATPTETLEVVGNAFVNSGKLTVSNAFNTSTGAIEATAQATSGSSGFTSAGKFNSLITTAGFSANNVGVLATAVGGTSETFAAKFQVNSGAVDTPTYGTYGVFSRNNATTTTPNYAGYFKSENVNGSSNHAIYGFASGTGTKNIAGLFNATGATNNYAIIVPSGGGNVGIGTVTPTESLEVAGKVLITQTDGLQLNQLNGRITIGNTISSTTHFLLRGTRPTLIDLGDATTSRFSVGANAQTIINYTSATGTIFRINRISENFAFTVRGDDGNVGIGVGSAPSRKLHVAGGLKLDSTTEALQVMRMTTTQRDALTAATGDIVYNTTTSKHQGYNGSVWNDLY